MKPIRISPVFMLGAALLVSFSLQARGKADKKDEGGKPIYFWHAFTDQPRSQWIQKIADQWNAQNSEKTGYKVIPESKGSYRETLNAAILSSRQGNAPHLVHIFEVGSQLALDAGIFAPVSSIGTFDFSDYIDSVLNYYRIDGQVNSIPFNSSSPVLFYNKDLMRQAGIAEPPQTFEAMLQALKTAKAKGIEAAGFGFNLHSWFFEQWVAQQGGLLANAENGRKGRATKLLLQSKEMQRVFRFVKDLNDRGFYKYTGKLEDWSGSEAIFTSGKVMFHMTSTADTGILADAAKGKFEIGSAFMPIPEGTERNGTVIGGGSIWFAKERPKTELTAARDFAVFLTNTKNMAEWHKVTGYYPVRKSSIQLLKDQGWFDSNALFTKGFDQLLATKSNNATAGALLGSFLDTRTIIGEAMQQVLGGKSIESALSEANTKANTKLIEYNQNVQ